MSSDLLNAIEQVSREKNISEDVIISAVEEAIIAAAKKIFKTDEDFGARFNRSTGDLEVWAVKKVVEEVTDPRKEISHAEASLYYEGVEVGYKIEFFKDTSKLGRIAAHTAKQVIMQKVRDAEKENIYDEFSQRIGEVVTGIVRRFERGNVLIDLGNGVEAIMHKEEQSRAERYKQNERIRVVIIGADMSSKEPQVKVSRADPRLLIKLFEMEVPEIYDNTVVLKDAAREAGDRAKVAVYSTDPDVDPIGACVGMGGSRVKSIIRELKGERLDIVRYSDDIVVFAHNALSPAQINRVVVVDPEKRQLEVIVDEEQLSLAIGKRGQNVRLASKLCGWSLEVKTEEQKREEVNAEMERMAEEPSEAEPVEVEGEAEVETEAESVAIDEAPEAEPVAEVEPEDVAAEEAVIAAADDIEDEESAEAPEEAGVPLAFLDGLSEETREVLAGYDIQFIEEVLYTPRDVLAEIPELEEEEIDRLITLAQDYASQFEAE